MKINSISASGLKGRSFTHQLAELNLITGQPFTGKSSRLEAVKLLLLGYSPRLGKTNTATFKLASDSQMGVGGSLDNGSAFSRTWTRNGKGVAYMATGSLPEIPPVLMDPTVYFSMGPTEQAKYIFGLSKVDDMINVDSIIADLKNLKFEENTEATQAALNDTVAYIDQSDRERNEAGGTLQDWIEEVMVKFSDDRKLTKKAIKEKAELIAGLTKLKAGDAGAGRDMQSEIDRLNQEITNTSVSISETTGFLEHKKAQKAERAGLEAKVAEAGPVQDQEQEIEKLHEQLTKMQVDMEQVAADLKLKSETKKQREDIQGKLATMESCNQDELDHVAKQVADYHSKTPELEKAWLKVMDVKSAASAKFNSAVAEHERYKQEKAKLDGMPCCPTCGTTGETLRELVATKYADILAELASVEKTAKKAFEDVRAKAAITEKSYRKSQEQDQQHQRQQAWLAEWKLKNQAVANLKARLDEFPEVTDEQISQINKAHVTLSINIKNTQAKLDELQANHRSFQQVKQAKDRLAEIPSVTDDELATLQTTINDLSDTLIQTKLALQQAQTAQKAFQAAQQDRKRLAQAELDKRSKEVSLKVLEAVVECLEDLRVKLVKATFGGLLEKANQVTAGILETPLEFNDGRLGRFKDGQFIGVETFSGCEEAITYAGMSVALAWDSPIRIVLMDELGSMGPEYLTKLLAIMKDLVAKGFIHQFIGVSITQPSTRVDGIKLIDLSQGA